MKKIKNLSTPRLVSALMALLLFFTAFASFGAVKADATTEQTASYSGAIYYFFDYYPSLKPADIQTYFSNNNVFYDRKHVSEQEFTEMVQVDRYFSNIPSGTVVMIDIRTFQPPISLLNELFYDLKNQGCITGFVSTYPQYMFTDGVLNYIDFHFETDLIRLKNFIRKAIENASSSQQVSTTSNVSILLDNNLIDVDAYQNASLYTLCEASPYLQFIIEVLAPIASSQNPSIYAGIAQFLSGNNVQLLVYTENRFVNILDWNDNNAYPEYLDNGFAIGFWQLDASLYNYLYDLKQQDYPNFPIYLFEAELIEYCADGLSVISESGLGHSALDEVSKDDDFLESFRSFLNSLD